MKTDVQLLQDVQDELGWEPVLHQSNIEVTVQNGTVTLYGQVNSLAGKWMAEKAAKRVQGVKAVTEHLRVEPPGEQPADRDITWAANFLFHWHCQIPQRKIRVRVSNGWVTLEGTVDEYFQKYAAEKALSFLLGVQGVDNRIEVDTHQTQPPRTAILEALQRNAVLEAQRVNVEVEGGEVILKGWVNSWMEHRAIEKIVWATPGVTSLKDDLVVSN